MSTPEPATAEKFPKFFPKKGLTKKPRCAKITSVAERKTKISITAEDILTVPQAAKELGVHFATVYRWINRGWIHPFRIAGQVFITVDEIKALKEQRASNGSAK